MMIKTGEHNVNVKYKRQDTRICSRVMNSLFITYKNVKSFSNV